MRDVVAHGLSPGPAQPDQSPENPGRSRSLLRRRPVSPFDRTDLGTSPRRSRRCERRSEARGAGATVCEECRQQGPVGQTARAGRLHQSPTSSVNLCALPPFSSWVMFVIRQCDPENAMPRGGPFDQIRLGIRERSGRPGRRATGVAGTPASRGRRAARRRRGRRVCGAGDTQDPAAPRARIPSVRRTRRGAGRIGPVQAG